MRKIKFHLYYTGLVMLVCACAVIDVFCQSHYQTFPKLDVYNVSYAQLLIATCLIGLLIGALSPSPRIACLASVASIALGIVVFCSTCFTHFNLMELIFSLYGLHWYGVQLLVGGLSGLIGRHLAHLLSELHKGYVEAYKTAQTTELHEQEIRRQITKIVWFWPALFTLVIFGIVLGCWLEANKVRAEKKEELLRMEKRFMALKYRMPALEHSAQEIYSLQKESPEAANAYLKDTVNRLNKDASRKDERQYLLSHPKEFPFAYRMFSNSIRENNRKQSSPPSH